MIVATVCLLLPFASLAALFSLMSWRDRRRIEALERQIAMTDAIHRDLGAVVAPTVTRSTLGRWRISVPVPFERPAVVSRVVEIAHDTVAVRAMVDGDAWEIVLLPQTSLPAPARRAGSRHGLRAASAAIGPGARTRFS